MIPYRRLFELEASSIKPPPRMGTKWKTEFIKGIGKRNENLIIILDIDRVFSADELVIAHEAHRPLSPTVMNTIIQNLENMITVDIHLLY